MKKVINYLKNLWSRMQYNELAATEAILIFLIIVGAVTLSILLLDPILRIN